MTLSARNGDTCSRLFISEDCIFWWNAWLLTQLTKEDCSDTVDDQSSQSIIDTDRPNLPKSLHKKRVSFEFIDTRGMRFQSDDKTPPSPRMTPKRRSSDSHIEVRRVSDRGDGPSSSTDASWSRHGSAKRRRPTPIDEELRPSTSTKTENVVDASSENFQGCYSNRGFVDGDE